MIYIKYIPVALSDEGRINIGLEFEPGKTVEEYLKKSGLLYEGQKIILTGRKIEDLNEKITRNIEEIIITPDIEGAVIPIVTNFFWTVGTWFGLKGVTATVVGGLATTATVVGAGYGVYKGYEAIQQAKEIDMTYPALQPMQAPSLPVFGSVSASGSSGTSIDAESPTYGFDDIRTTASVGLAIPVIYGTHKVGGNIINQYIWNSGDKNYLNMLLSLGYGEIESITEIKINGNPIANFDGVSTYERYGTNNQTVISHFGDLHNVYTIGTSLSPGGSTTYTTSDSDVEAFEINFTMPAGLYQINSTNSSTQNYTISITVQYKVYGTGTWTSSTFTVTRAQKSAVRFKRRIEGLTAGRYDIRITNNNGVGSAYQVASLSITTIDEIKTDDLAYPGLALLGLRLLATDQISGGSPNVTCVVKGKKVSVPYLTISGTEIDQDDVYYDSASSQWKRFSDDTACTWNGAYVTRYSSNPVWCLKDLLTNTEYGLGESINTDFLDDDLFLEMARYCDEKVDDGDGGYEKRFELHVVLDSYTRAPDLISQLAEVFRGFAFMSGGKVSLSLDKEADPAQMFGMGNIIKDSFSISKKSLKETYNVVEVTFKNRDLDYKDETIAVYDDSSFASGNPARVKKIRHYSTKLSQAVRAGRYTRDILKYITETITLKGGIDSIYCKAGDRVDVSHDVPQWGFSGRVKSGSTVDLVKMDQTVTIEAGSTYKIQIRFSDDTLEERTVTDAAGDYTEVNVTPSFSQAPAAFDKYAFGVENVLIKPFRVTGFRKENSNEVLISAIEYNESVYDDSAPSLPTNNYSALLNTIPDVTDLTLSEHMVKLKDGTIENVIDVFFQKPSQSSYYIKQYAKAWIYLREGTSGDNWVFKGESYGEYFEIRGNITDTTTYTVTVVSVTDKNQLNSFDNSPNAQITVAGKTAAPSDVDNFDVSQEANLLRFSWDPISDPDLARYVIKKGSTWSSGIVIAELVDTTEFMSPVGQIGEVSYMIKAVDTSGNESDTPAIDVITITKPPEMNFLNEFDLFSQDLDFSLSGTSILMRNDYNENYVRPVIALSSAETWEEWEATGGTWEDDEENIFTELGEGPFESTGAYEMKEPLDLGTIFEFKIVVDADYKNVTGGSVAVYISFSEDDVTYSAFELVSAAETYRGKYVKFKVILSTADTNYNVYLYGLTIYLNAPVTLVDWVRDIAIASGGTRINFGQDFTYPPRVSANIVNGIVGFLKLYDKTISGISARIYADYAQTTPVSGGEIDLDAKGY